MSVAGVIEKAQYCFSRSVQTGRCDSYIRDKRRMRAHFPDQGQDSNLTVLIFCVAYLAILMSKVIMQLVEYLTALFFDCMSPRLKTIVSLFLY